MNRQLYIRVKTRQFHMYNQRFSFFHSNSINKILTSKKIDQVILFRDLQFYDDQTQYLKRTYHQTQAFNRIKKLISNFIQKQQRQKGYYEKNMTPPSPLLLTIEQYQYLDNRNRKILKLCIMKQKSQQQGQKEKKKSFIKSDQLKGSNTSAMNDILPKLQESNLENIADSDRDQSQQVSYDSQAHDVFHDFYQKASQIYSVGNVSGQYKEILSVKNIKQSSLVINFRTVNQPPSDVNNLENFQPKIIISEPPKQEVKGLKFNKGGNKNDDIIITNNSISKNESQNRQTSNFQSYKNQNQSQKGYEENNNGYQNQYQGVLNNYNHQIMNQGASNSNNGVGMFQIQTEQFQYNGINSQNNMMIGSGYEIKENQNSGTNGNMNYGNYQNQQQGQYNSYDAKNMSSGKKGGNFNKNTNQNNEFYQNQNMMIGQQQMQQQNGGMNPMLNNNNYMGNGNGNMGVNGMGMTNMMQNNNQIQQNPQMMINSNSVNQNSNFPPVLSNQINNANKINNINSPSSNNANANKKGKISFMQYYHSVPVKNPTNILQKFMKNKK